MHILGQMWNGKGERERERKREACCAQSKAEEQMVSQPRLARFINLFGAERIGTKPDLFSPSIPTVRRSDSRIEQWREILHSRQRAGRARAPLGVGTDGGTRRAVKREH